jgi:hypothetical protein
MKIRLFTAEEASALAPFLEVKMQKIRALKLELNAMSAQFEVLDLIADSGADEDNPDTKARNRLQRRSEKLAEELASELAAVKARGCVVKDLERGLVDFYSLLGDRLVFLCWEPGEREVAFWHPLAEGYTSRRPLETMES